ncbi:hypothetical protein Z043_105458 [Scleropages formosus]|uniref:Uncharacterized protein n=1 Tax=Scleropages formosus TaxID=113540 RepID=A0A0P7VPF1_SCLFO|nr:hypothetical protein Z043_105458 [Scleropages formosus]
MASSANEEKTFRRFLELFLREMRAPLREDEPLPMRPLSDQPALSLPTYSNCPFSLAAGLARATTDDILQSDLSTYHVNKGVEDGPDTLPRESSSLPNTSALLHVISVLAI